MYVEYERKENKTQLRVQSQGDGKFTIENLATGKTQEVEAKDLEYEKNALVWMTINGDKRCFQLHDILDDISYKFYFKGFPLHVKVYDADQQPLAQYMPPPKFVNHAKMILSEMPGGIVNVLVEVGQKVNEGQELLTIEAMKMQNLIKSEVEGVVKSIYIKPGDAVPVDFLMIEFE